eukprot:TRINITY_DN3494_c0_g3_i1.p1 TRINITY_DN3494_c0_g3~~TRINITY_DN3494_c0_g3_i1.p1  ORF type:complete len:374 (-),score=44.81 TRINITY_DN3494_c0_g3_i1:23-1144(-)
MISNPIFGILTDAGYSRKKLLFFGIVSWSLSTVGTYFSTNYTGLFVSRSFVGVGEACFSVIGPSLLGDFFMETERTVIFMIYNIAMPFGAALGFLLGGWIGEMTTWRIAFLICGFPGILLSFCVYFISEPEIGRYDNGSSNDITLLESCKLLFTNKPMLVLLGATVCFTFSAGGLADWLVPFFHRKFGTNIKYAGLLVGIITVIGGIGGTIIGGVLANIMKLRMRNALFGVSCIGVVASVPFIAISLFVPSENTSLILILVGQLLFWWSSGPTDAIVANVVHISARAKAYALYHVANHLLGDSISPIIIGAVNDKVNDISLSLLITPVVLAISGIFWGYGWIFLPKQSLVTSRNEETEEFVVYGESSENSLFD